MDYSGIATEFLSEYQKIVNKINKLNDKYLELENEATGVKSSLNYKRGKNKQGESIPLEQSQHDNFAKEKKITKYIDDQNKIISEVLEYRIMLLKIEETIRDLMPPSNERAAVMCRTTQNYSYAKIGEVINRSNTRARYIYLNGLQILGEALYIQAKELNII